MYRRCGRRKPVVVRIDEGLSISRTDKKPMPTSAAIKHATPSVESSTARFFNRRKSRRCPAERLCAGSGTGVSCSQRPPDHRKARIDRQQEPPRTRRGDQPRDDRSQQQERSVTEYLTDGQVTGHPLAGNDGRQQRVDGHLNRRVADAQQAETDESTTPGRIRRRPHRGRQPRQR